MSQREILLIGGGLAGLSAAGRLIDMGHAVTLLEARDRLGGRAWSVERPGAPPIELGAEWVSDEGVVRALCREAGIRLVAAHGEWLRRVGSGWQSLDGLPGQKTLARPIEKTLCLAGEACAGDGLNATMEGAIESGRRAAAALG